MTYQEFKKIVDTDRYDVTETDDLISVVWKSKNKIYRNYINIYKSPFPTMEINFDVFDEDEVELLKNAVELAKTPLEERGPEKKYYLRHKFIVPMFSSFKACLILNYDAYYLGSPNQYPDHQSTFTKKEIEDIKNKFDVTLEDFEIVEVEEWLTKNLRTWI